MSDAVRSEYLEAWRLLELARQTIACLLRYAAPASRVEVHEQGRWFRRDAGSAVDCARRPVLRRLVVALAAARLETPGRVVPVDRLVELAWPGQRMHPASGRRRLQVAVSRLRALGLVIANDPDGYLIEPAFDVSFAR